MATICLVRRSIDYTTPQATPRVIDPLMAFAQNIGDAPSLADVQVGEAAWHEDGTLMLHPAIDCVGAGDTVVVRRFATLASDPHTAIAAVRALVARGVRVRILEIAGHDPVPHLDFAASLLSLMDDMTAQIEAERERADNAQRDAWETADSVWREALGEMLKAGKLGVHIPQIGPASEPDRPEVGAALKALRTQRKMTQARLAELVGSSQAQIARLEANGREGELLTKAVAALAGGFNAERDDATAFLQALALKLAATETEQAA